MLLVYAPQTLKGWETLQYNNRAKLLGRVNKQIFKVNLKNLFCLYLVVLFCCNVGDSDCVIKAGCRPSNVSYKTCGVFSANEVLYQKY